MARRLAADLRRSGRRSPQCYRRLCVDLGRQTAVFRMRSTLQI